jgi:glycosyltransferase involved in cell wall biosynthesis
MTEKFFSKPRFKKHKTFKIGYIAGFSYYKNATFAIDAVKQVEGNDIVFELWARRNGLYKNLVEQAKDDHRIRFMGFAPEDRLVDVYDSFDVFLYPSLYEGFGLAMIEAQARGLPVIIYKKAHIPKEVRRYCFEADDEQHMAQIIAQIKSNGYDEKRRRKAMTYAKAFTWKREIVETLAVYRKVYETK